MHVNVFDVFYSLYSHQHVSATIMAIFSDVITNFDPYLYYLILPEIIIICNCYGVTAIQLTTFVPLCSCNNNITLKMTVIAVETCW